MNSFLSDKSSIIVLSNSMDSSETTPSSSSNNQAQQVKNEPISILTIESQSSMSSNSTRINCVSDSMANNSNSHHEKDLISKSVENDGISVINVIESHRNSAELCNQVQALNKIINDYQHENSELKEQYNFLTNQIEKLTDSQAAMIKSSEPSISQKTGDAYLEDNQFIDVQSLVIVEKIKDYLTETDRLLDDEQKNFKLAMSYMINHFWSMIAHQYNDENLVKLKILRDSLLRKIDKVDQVLKSSREESRNMSALGHASQSSINSSIHVIDYSSEMEAFNQDALLIKDKLEQQNEIIKSLLSKIQEKEAAEKRIESEASKQEVKAVDQEEEEDEDEHDISPGSSPSSYMFNYFQKKFASKEPSIEATEEADVPTLTEERPAESQDEPVSNNTSDDSLPSNTDDSDSSFYYYYNVNDFIAIDKTLALSEDLANQVQSVPSTPNTSSNNNDDEDEAETARQQETASLSTLRPNEEEPAESETARATNNDQQTCYQCPICNVSVDAKLVSFRKFELHVGECTNTESICIFCLEKFDTNDPDAYEAHINSHMI